MRMRLERILTVAAMACVLAAVPSRGDVLELRDGRVLTGKYSGGTAGTIRFEMAGSVQVIEASQALALTFTGAPPGAEPAPVTPAAAPTAPPTVVPAAVPSAPAATAGIVAVPAGAVLMVRMVDGATSKGPQGKRFATVLETDLVVNQVRVAKAGSKVYGRIEKAVQAGRFAGKSTLDLRLCELTVGGVLVPIVTGPYMQAGTQSFGKTAKGALAGAAIGGLASGSDDVAKGAAVGALVSGLKPGQPIVVPPGTLLEFKIQQPFTVNPPR